MSYRAKAVGTLPIIKHVNGLEYRVHAVTFVNDRPQFICCHSIEDGECVTKCVATEYVVNLDEFLADIKEE
jgi:hypothetical protein